jgi:serine/threonine-protein kinase
MASMHFGRLSGALGFTRTVAIKRLHAHVATDPEFVAMFLDEARLAARIHHPNVVGTFDVATEDGELFLVMQYVHGEALSGLLRNPGSDLPAAYAVGIVLDALHGLHAAHEARSAAGDALGIVHRDVSPHNVLVGVDGVARIIDFGIAKAKERLHQTRGAELRGKIAYMAPELLRREPVDRRADVYAASVVLWEALTRRRFVDADNGAAALRAVLERSPEPPSSLAPGLPQAIDDIVLRGLSRDPEARFATAIEMATALEAALAPASKRQIGAWVAQVAAPTLSRRAAALGQIEVDPGAALEPPANRTPPGSAARGYEDASASGACKDAAHVLPATTDRGTRGPRRAWRPIVSAAAVAGVVLVQAALIGAARGPKAAAAPRETVDAPLRAAAPAVSGPVAPGLRPAAPDAPAPSQAPVPAAPLPRHAPAARAAPHPAPKAPACRQPFTDDHGIKVPKLECL